MPTQKEISEHLDMSERNVRDVLNGLTDKHERQRDWWKSASLEEIRILYIRDLREKASGRSGEAQHSLTRARTEAELAKAAKTRLEYNRDIGTAIYTEDAAEVLNDWARFANREYMQGMHKLVAEIQSAYSIKLPTELVENIVSPTIERIKDHADKLGRDLVEGIEPIQ